MDDKYYNDEEENAHTHADNAVVNNEGGDSQTPSVLVAESPSETYEEESQHGSKLSPNPANFGFTKQLFVNSLPENPIVNTLYILNVYNNGTLVGYRYYKWNPSDGWVLLQNVNEPNQTPVKGEQIASEDNAIVVNEPREVESDDNSGGSSGGGDTLYVHNIRLSDGTTDGAWNTENNIQFQIISKSPSLINTPSLLYNELKDKRIHGILAFDASVNQYIEAIWGTETNLVLKIAVGEGAALGSEDNYDITEADVFDYVYEVK